MAHPAYGPDHQARRARLLPRAWNQPCALCGQVMLRGQDLDLDHSRPKVLHRGSRGDRIVHASCNRSAGGRLGQERQRMRPSRSW